MYKQLKYEYLTFLVWDFAKMEFLLTKSNLSFSFSKWLVLKSQNRMFVSRLSTFFGSSNISVWISVVVIRVEDLMAAFCCCKKTHSAMTARVSKWGHSQLSLIGARSTSNCVETLTLLFTKLYLKPHQSQTRVLGCSARSRADYHSQKNKKRWETGKNLYCSCQNFILSEFFLFKCLTISKHTPT